MFMKSATSFSCPNDPRQPKNVVIGANVVICRGFKGFKKGAVQYFRHIQGQLVVISPCYEASRCFSAKLLTDLLPVPITENSCHYH